MKNTEKQFQSKIPTVKINKALDLYKDKILFKEKVEEANETLQRVGLPELLLNAKRKINSTSYEGMFRLNRSSMKIKSTKNQTNLIKDETRPLSNFNDITSQNKETSISENTLPINGIKIIGIQKTTNYLSLA